MGRPAQYPEEFRREAVESSEAPGALDTDERAELDRLRKEVRDLRMDREMLHKLSTQRGPVKPT